MFQTKKELRKTIEYLRDQRRSEREIRRIQEDIIESYESYVELLKVCIENDNAFLRKLTEYIDPTKIQDYINNMDRLFSEYREAIEKGDAETRNKQALTEKE